MTVNTNLVNETAIALNSFIGVSKRKYNELIAEGYYVTSVTQINAYKHEITIINDEGYERSIDSFGKVCNYGKLQNSDYLTKIYGENFTMTDALGELL